MRHLILNLESPLMSFGGETVDNYGVIRPFPAASLLTGMIANAFGWDRTERRRHQRLQDRLVFAARIDREPAGGVRMTDFQTAQLGARDQGWTTRGTPEGRTGGPNTYLAPHLRYRDYFADMRVKVALRLEPIGESPTLDDVAEALEEPARPLFIGRKTCLPSGPLFGGFIDGDSVVDALLRAPAIDHEIGEPRLRFIWPQGERFDTKHSTGRPHSYMLTDQRNWVSGLHGGGRPVHEAVLELPPVEDHQGTPRNPGGGQTS